MKKLSAPLFFIFYLCIVLLVATILVLFPGSASKNGLYPVAKINVSVKGGYTVEDVEQNITHVLERSVSRIDEDLYIESVSSPNGAFITVYSNDPEDEYKLFDALRNATDKRSLPQDDDLDVMLARPAKVQQCYVYTLSSKQHSEVELRQFNQDEIVPRIESRPEIISVETVGGKEQVLNICPYPGKLEKLSLDLPRLYEKIRLETTWPLPARQMNEREIENLMLRYDGDKSFYLRDVCSIKLEEELVETVAGGKSGALVCGLVYFDERLSAGEAEEKIKESLEGSSLEKSGYEVQLFGTQDPPLKNHVSIRRSVFVCAIGFVLVFVLSLFSQLSPAKKWLVLSLTFAMAIGIPLVKYFLNRDLHNNDLHLVVNAKGFDGPEKNIRLQELAKKLSGKGVNEWLWYSEKSSFDFSDPDNIHILVRLQDDTDREQYLQYAYEAIQSQPGIRLEQFPQTPLFSQHTLILSGPDPAYITKQLYEKLHTISGVSHIFAQGSGNKPRVQYNISREDMVKHGISMGEVQRFFDMMNKNTFDLPGTSIKLSFDCGNAPVAGVFHYRDMNQGGKLVSLDPFIREEIVSEPEAVYHRDGKRYATLILYLEDENARAGIDRALNEVAISNDCTIQWQDEND